MPTEIKSDKSEMTITDFVKNSPAELELEVSAGDNCLEKSEMDSEKLQKNELAPQITIHGVLLGIYGIGVLIVGESGIGKSECALDLITRGHSLVSDDAVCIRKIGSRLEGRSPELTFEHIEIRGLGILNIRDLFGVSSVRKCKSIALCIELKKWKDVEEIERVGLEMRQENIFGIEVPKVVLPVSSGRNLSTLVETAVRVHLLQISGGNAARKLIEKHTTKLSEKI